MQTVSPQAILYLEDASPILEEVITDYATWSRRSPEEKEALTRWVHDYAVGEDWTEEDSWADVSFTPEEIQAFSSHVLVRGDDGLPEWYHRHAGRRDAGHREYDTPPTSSHFSTLKNTDNDASAE